MWRVLLFVGIGMMVLGIGCFSAEPAPVAQAILTATSTPSPTNIPTATATQTATPRPPNTPTQTNTPTPTNTATPIATKAPTQTSTPLPSPTPTLEPRVWADGVEIVATIESHHVEWSPSANELLFVKCSVSIDDGNDEDQIFVFDAASDSTYRLNISEFEPHFCQFQAPAWIEDGRSIAWVAFGLYGATEIYRTNLQSQESLLIDEDNELVQFRLADDSPDFWFTDYAKGGHNVIFRFNSETQSAETLGLIYGNIREVSANFVAVGIWPENIYRMAALWQRSDKSLEPSNAIMPFPDGGHPYTEMWTLDTEFENTEFVSWNADDDQMLVRAWNGFSHTNADEFEQTQKALLLWDVPSGDVKVLFDDMPGIKSNGGEWIAYSDGVPDRDAQKISLLNLNSGIIEYEIETFGTTSGYWISQELLVFRTPENQLSVFNVKTGQEHRITQSGSTFVGNVKVSHDQQYLSVTYCPDGSNQSCSGTLILRVSDLGGEE